MNLITPSRAYKPFRYPWAYDYWLIQQQVHWLPEEVPLGEDIKDWRTNLDDAERSLLTQIFRFFTQSDVEVNNNYMERYAGLFKPTEVRMMLSAFSNMETIHIAAYALLLETIGMGEEEFEAFLDYKEMQQKQEFMESFDVKDRYATALTLAAFAAFVEGLQLFASFAMLLNFPRFNKMKGMGQIITWSIRDESLHCEGMIQLYHTFTTEFFHKDVLPGIHERLIRICRNAVELEDSFIDLAFSLGPVRGLAPEDVKRYIRFVANWRLRQLGVCAGIYEGVDEHPLPWLLEITNGVEHSNFFESRATEYSKASSKGTWPDTWGQFDAREEK